MGVKHYSQEEEDWLRAQYPNHTVPELVQLFSEAFRQTTGSAIRTKLSKMGLSTKQGNMRLTAEQSTWLIVNHDQYSILELANMFTMKFGRQVSPSKMSTWCAQRGLHKKKPWRQWTNEEESFLKNNYSSMRLDSFVEAFNAKFNTNLAKRNVVDKARRLGVHATLEKQLIGKNLCVHTISPIGAERYYAKRKSVLVKCADEHYGHNWRDKKFVVWEKRHGPIPEGMCIICLDGDNTNCDDDNMMLVTPWIRHKFRLYNRSHCYRSKELMRAYIMAWQLKEVCENIKKEG